MALLFGCMMLRPELAALGVLIAEAVWACWVGGRASADGAYNIKAKIACEAGQLGASCFIIKCISFSQLCCCRLACSHFCSHAQAIYCLRL
jgi:hypothetical protein